MKYINQAKKSLFTYAMLLAEMCALTGISSFFSRTSRNCNVNFTTLDFGAGKI